jgi:hypothetical protein
MKRVILAAVSTLALSTLITPEAQAIRPELLPQSVHPTLSSKTLNTGTQSEVELSQKSEQMPAEQKHSEVQVEKRDEPSSSYFDKVYREKYGL